MYVAVAKVVVVPLETSLGPPVSSKVLKYCFGSYLRRKVVGSLSNLSISMLFNDSKPLYSRGDNPVVLEMGRRYVGRISVLDEDLWLFDAVSKLGSEFKCSGSYGSFSVSIAEVEVLPMSSLKLELPEVFKVVFRTPTILSSKLMCPPTLADKVRPMHRLIPQPSLIFSHLLRMWNTFAPPDLRIGKQSEWAPYLLGRQADITLVEVDYNVKPETVVVGRDSEGKLRKVRGFMGWIMYRSIAPRRLHETYSRLLALAQLVGVGRSRGIGFGHVTIETDIQNTGRAPTEKLINP